jgi:hypothetical protein
MRWPLAIALLVAFCAGARAMPSPSPAPPIASLAADSAIYRGPSGAMLEADYFRAPKPRYGVSHIFPCHLHLRIAESTRRIVQSCD